jgi:hypothetical protein
MNGYQGLRARSAETGSGDAPMHSLEPTPLRGAA